MEDWKTYRSFSIVSSYVLLDFFFIQLVRSHLGQDPVFQRVRRIPATATKILIETPKMHQSLNCTQISRKQLKSDNYWFLIFELGLDMKGGSTSTAVITPSTTFSYKSV